jgi:hypothetical protein
MELEIKNKHKRDKFIKFNGENHVYYIHNKIFNSVTTIIKSLFHEFNEKEILKKLSLKNKTNIEDIKKEWDDKRNIALREGVKLHQDIELYLNNEKYENTSIEFSYFLNFVKDHYYLEPFRTEWKIFDEDSQIAGTIDMCYKNNDNFIDIYDWKRCKSIIKENKYKKYAKVDFLQDFDDTNYNHYSLQLNLYKYILEKNYNYKVRNLFIVCFHPINKNENYLLYKIPCMKNEIKKIIKWYQKSS